MLFALLPRLDCLRGPLGGQQPHLPQRLANRGDAWRRYYRGKNVVETYHRTILGDTQTGFSQAAHHTERGQIVESDHRAKRPAGSQHLFRKTKSAFKTGCRIGEVRQLINQAPVDLNSSFFGRALSAGPSRLAVEQLLRPTDHRDAPMPEVGQMP